MKDLESKLVEILSALQSAASAATDMAAKELPIMAQQYVAYGTISSAVWLGISVLALATIVMVTLKLKPSKYDGKSLHYLLGSIIALPFLILFIASLHEFMFVYFAPKIWLITELAKLRNLR